MEGSVLSFLKVEWKVSDTGSAHWASSYNYVPYVRFYSLYIEVILNNPETSYLNLPSVSE
jgi:hypothetical protein